MSKTFLVTGASRGLGRSIAVAALEAGHQVIATARKPELFDDLVARHGQRILPVRLDVTDAGAAADAIQRGIAVFGSIDVVINNAGFANVGAVEDMSMDGIASQFATNFFGSVHVIKAVLPHLRRQGAGRIIQVSSIGARTATAGAAAYYASKAALAGLIESLALELGPLGIKVTMIEPGGMKTDFAEDSSISFVPVSAPYDSTVGITVQWMKTPGYANDYSEPDDVAALIMKVAELDEPPLRLLAGKDAVAYAAAAEEARRATDAKWRWLSIEPGQN
jgi:NAD(P)-dependent dehydrogenase (short-subunit alcohol dehydrogenase family)